MRTKDNGNVIRHDEIVQMLNKFHVKKAPWHVDRNTFNNIVNNSANVVQPAIIIRVSEGNFSIRIHAAVVEDHQKVRKLVIANM